MAGVRGGRQREERGVELDQGGFNRACRFKQRKKRGKYLRFDCNTTVEGQLGNNDTGKLERHQKKTSRNKEQGGTHCHCVTKGKKNFGGVFRSVETNLPNFSLVPFLPLTQEGCIVATRKPPQGEPRG